jgi:hypothetical protein
MTTYTAELVGGCPTIIIDQGGKKHCHSIFFPQTNLFAKRDAEMACDTLNKFSEKQQQWAGYHAYEAQRIVSNP